MKTIVLQPSAKARQAPDFNREAYVDFVAVQIKFLSFLAYIIRIYQDQVGGGSDTHTHSIIINLSSTTYPKPKGQPVKIQLPAQANLIPAEGRATYMRTRGWYM